MTWPMAPLGTLAEIQLGKMLSPRARTGEASFPYLRNVNVQWGQLDLSDLLEMDFSEDEREKFSLRAGDLLVCEGGEPGRAVVVPHDLPGVYFQKALMRVRPRDARLHTGFLQRFMHYSAARGAFAKGGNQATIAHFPAVRLNAFPVPLPPIAEQRRIADILDKADTIRRKRKEAIALIEELLRSAFLEMFGDPVTNPKGWPVRSLGELLAVEPRIGSLVPASDGPGTPIVRVGELGAYDVALARSKRAPLSETELARFSLARGDVLLAGSIGSEDHLGKASVFQAHDEVVAFDSHVMRLRFREDALDPYVFVQWLRTPGGRARFMNEAGRTAVQFNVNGKQIVKVQIPLPPIQAQRRFRGLFDAVRHMEARSTDALSEANRLFDALVARAFAGELESPR